MLSHAIPRSAAQRRMLLTALVLIAATPALASASPMDAQAQARALLAGPALAAAGFSPQQSTDAHAPLDAMDQARSLLAGPHAPTPSAAASADSHDATNPARRMILGKDA